MAAPISPGDWLECIRTDECGGVRVLCGVPYQVIAIRGGAGPCLLCESDAPGLEVAGVVLPIGWAWCHCCFRPMSDGEERWTFQSLLAPSPSLTPEDA